MIGDNENDYSAARAAGVPVILMRYGYLRVPPETLVPDAWLDNFGDLPRTINHSLRVSRDSRQSSCQPAVTGERNENSD